MLTLSSPSVKTIIQWKSMVASVLLHVWLKIQAKTTESGGMPIMKSQNQSVQAPGWY